MNKVINLNYTKLLYVEYNKLYTCQQIRRRKMTNSLIVGLC